MKFSPEIYTPLVQESAQFYCQFLGFTIKQEVDGFIVLQHPVHREYQLMFCVPKSQFVSEIFRPAFSGKGLIFQLEVEDVEREFKRLKSKNAPMVLDLVEEPFNGKHFTIQDPNGILIDIAELQD